MSEQLEETNVVGNSNALSVPAAKDVNVYQGSNINALNLFDERQLAIAEVVLKKMMASDKGGFKSIPEGIAILLRAQDLKLPFSTCIEHIHVINNKTGVDIHIIKSLLLRAGITWKCVKDYIPLYEYTDSINVYVEDKLPSYCIKCNSKQDAEKHQANDEENVYVYPVKYYSDFNGVIYKDYQLTSSFAIALNQKHATEIAKNGKCPIYRIPAQPIDYYTEYELTRIMIVKGKEIVMKNIGHFSYSEALIADLFVKDTYKKYARIMIGNRAFTYAARDIADDLLMGCMESGELKIVEDAPLNFNDIISVEEITD